MQQANNLYNIIDNIIVKLFLHKTLPCWKVR